MKEKHHFSVLTHLNPVSQPMKTPTKKWKGGNTGTCKDTFSKCLKVGDAIAEDDQRLIQKNHP